MNAKPDPRREHEPAAKSGKTGPIEFSREIAVDLVPDAGLDVSISADEAERERLAAYNGLVAIESLTADFHISKASRGRFPVTGVLRAHVMQTCVVSLEPFETEIETEIEVEFALPADAAVPGPPHTDSRSESGPSGHHLEIDLDAPDPIEDERIDLGALASEFLVLSLDPYPRKPGARFDERTFGSEDAERETPFSVLSRIKPT